MKRIGYIDLIRAICIILMILGHIWLGNSFNHFIHAFHMPVFFIISGYFFKDISFKMFLKKKLKTLIFPYFVFAFLIYIIWYLLFSKTESMYIYSNIINIFYKNTEHIAIAGALWFLTSLFFSELIYFFISKIKKTIIHYSSIIIVSLIGCVLGSKFNVILPFGINASLVGVGLMKIGCIFKKYSNNKFLNLSLFSTIILSFITSFSIFFNKYINMRTNNYEYILLFWINVVLSFISLINFTKYFDIKFSNAIKEKFLYIGTNSIVYVIFNQLFIVIFQKIFDLFIISENYFVKISEKFVLFVLTMLFIKLLSLLINGTKLKILIGKEL